MFEVIALFFLCRYMGRLAVKKGLNKVSWIVYTILGWIMAEFIGVFLGLVFFGQNNIPGLMALGLISAFGGYLFVKYKIDQVPDINDDDINNIGSTL